MDDSERWYYIKKGRRYERVEMWCGFPTDGVWIVKNAPGVKSSRLMLQLTSDPYHIHDIINKAITKDKIAELVIDVFSRKVEKARSVADIADEVGEKIWDALQEENN